MLVFWLRFPRADIIIFHKLAPVNVRNIVKTQIVAQTFHFGYNDLQQKLYTKQSAFQLRKASEKITSLLLSKPKQGSFNKTKSSGL